MEDDGLTHRHTLPHHSDDRWREFLLFRQPPPFPGDWDHLIANNKRKRFFRERYSAALKAIRVVKSPRSLVEELIVMGIFGYYRSYSSSSDGSGGWIFFGFIGALFFIGWIFSSIGKLIERKAKERSDGIIASRKREVDAYFSQKQSEVDASKKKVEADIAKKQKFLEEARTQFKNGYIAGRKWLAQFIANAETSEEEALAEHLKNKSRPAVSASEHVKSANRKRREAIARTKYLEYALAAYKEYFPILEEYEDAILDEIGGFTPGGTFQDAEENLDPAVKYLTSEEYRQLSSTERNQRALDAYKTRHKPPLEIGRMYERYLGYIYETQDWDVHFHGVRKGFEDMGRDLICKRGEETQIVQAKCWSRSKVIHEKHVFQLYGTCLEYQIAEETPVGVIFATTTELSEIAKIAAQRLGLTIWNQALDRDYPMIKCNVNQGERIYHLPFDQQYDRIKIRQGEGECYVRDIAEAEDRGFRRAKRWKGPRLNSEG